jgi:XTP/dITP diphosphohydrolase
LKLIFATNNEHKVVEIRKVVGSQFDILTLKEADILIDIPEPFDSLEENARNKSKTIFEMTGTNCFSEDTGLFVDGLNGEPGVKSARYAGESRSFDDNIIKLLTGLSDSKNRKARFRTIISLIIDGKETLFEGICEGHITESKRGVGGFGYDPIFVPEGSTLSFAEMTMVEKNEYSHRRKAMDKLLAFLKTSTIN